MTNSADGKSRTSSGSTRAETEQTAAAVGSVGAAVSVSVLLDSGKAVISHGAPARTTAEYVEGVGHALIDDFPVIPAAFEPGEPDDG